MLEIRAYEPGYLPEHERLGEFTMPSAAEMELPPKIYERRVEVDASVEVTFAFQLG